VMGDAGDLEGSNGRSAVIVGQSPLVPHPLAISVLPGQWPYGTNGNGASPGSPGLFGSALNDIGKYLPAEHFVPGADWPWLEAEHANHKSKPIPGAARHANTPPALALARLGVDEMLAADRAFAPEPSPPGSPLSRLEIGRLDALTGAVMLTWRRP
jgi:hypothetical protein